MGETLSNLGTPQVTAEERTNVTGQMDDILAFIPNDGLKLLVQNMVEGKEGVPIYLELRDSNGNLLPLDTELVLRWDAPHLPQPQVISDKLANIRQYRTLSIKDQQNEDYRDRTRIELNGRELEVEDVEEFQIAIKSSKQIDWSQSKAYVEDKATNVTTGGA